MTDHAAHTLAEIKALRAERDRLAGESDKLTRALAESNRTIGTLEVICDGHDAYRRSVIAEIAQLRADLAALRAHEAEGWRDIASAPKDGTIVLVSDRHGAMTPCFWNDKSGYKSAQWLAVWDHKNFSDPSHWRPLPTKPERT